MINNYLYYKMTKRLPFEIKLLKCFFALLMMKQFPNLFIKQVFR